MIQKGSSLGQTSSVAPLELSLDELSVELSLDELSVELSLEQ
jgi:hypothetical protein